MAASRQILCVDKTPLTAAHERIAHVGGVAADGKPWSSTQAEAVADMEAGRWRFYASVWGRAVWIVVASDAEGRRFLKTETDGTQPNNLLTLPQCG